MTEWDIWLKKGERVDDVGFGGLFLIQKPAEFCYGIDGVLLADFAELKKGNRAVDLGTGTGIIPLILSYKSEGTELWGLEVQEASFERALRTVALNGLTHRIHLICSDVKEAVAILGAGSFDTVISNPPYNSNKDGLKNVNMAKTIARHEITGTLEDFIESASGLLKDRGDFYLVHRPSRLVDIFILARKYRLEPKTIRFVSPRFDEKPNIVLIHCVKNAGPELRFLDPLFVYDKNGEYTKEIQNIYERKKTCSDTGQV